MKREVICQICHQGRIVTHRKALTKVHRDISRHTGVTMSPTLGDTMSPTLGDTKVFGWKLEIYCNDGWYEVRKGDELPTSRHLKRRMIQEDLRCIIPEERERLDEWFLPALFTSLMADI